MAPFVLRYMLNKQVNYPDRIGFGRSLYAKGNLRAMTVFSWTT